MKEQINASYYYYYYYYYKDVTCHLQSKHASLGKSWKFSHWSVERGNSAMLEESIAPFARQCFFQHGPSSVSRVKTLSTEDTSDPRHFGTIRLVPKCPDSSAPVPKCIADTSALVPNCFDLQQTFFCYNSHTYKRFTVILLVITIKEDNDYSHTVNDFLNYKSE